MKPVVVLDARYAHLLPDMPPELGVVSASLDDLQKLETPDATVRVVIAPGNMTLTESMKALPNLGLVSVIGSGYEGFDLEDLNARGIALSYNLGSNAPEVATHAVALFLGHNRLLLTNDRRVRAGLFRDRAVNSVIRSAAGLKMGILGLGGIGKGIAQRLAGFECEIAWWGPNPKPDEPLPRRETLMDLATWCDVLFVAARAHPSNDGLVSREVIEAVGPRGLIVNIARGSIIDEDALIAALHDGRLGGAALDVFVQEPTPGERWRDVPNTLLSPHTGATGELTRRAMALESAENARRFLAGEPLLGPAPGSMPRTRGPE